MNHSPSYNRRPSAIDNHKRLRQLVNRHLSVNDVPAAVRAVASDNTLCDITPDVLESLQSRHPPAPSNIEIIPIPTNIPSMTTSSQDIREAIRSFSGSSGGSVDGLRPIHLQDLISNQTAEAGIRLILSLTSLVNTILNGQISDFARIIFFSANLTALRKKDGGIRPIAVGNILRRLASKVANHFASHKVANFLRPFQLGVSVKNACEAAVHSARIITKLHSSITGHKKRFQLHTTRYSSAQMIDKLPRDFQTSVISVWLTNSSYGQWKLNLV